MTAVAKFVLMRDGEKVLLHHNIGAYDPLYLSAAGPDLTVRYLDAYHATYGSDTADSAYGPAGWDHRAEGGVLVDCEQRVLLVFTIYTSTRERAAYLAAVAQAWPEWRVEWASDGIADLMRHAGDGDLVSFEDRRAGVEKLTLGHQVYGRYESQVRCVHLVTVTDPDGDTTAHSVSYPSPWWVGEPLLGALCDQSRVDSCPTMPDGGLHLDHRTHEAWLWTCCDRLFGVRERWADLWPGWTLTFCEDRYAEQLDRCAGVVDVPVPPASDGFAPLRQGFEIHWRNFVPDHPDRQGFFDEEINERLTVTRAEFDAALALISPPEPQR